MLTQPSFLDNRLRLAVDRIAICHYHGLIGWHIIEAIGATWHSSVSLEDWALVEHQVWKNVKLLLHTTWVASLLSLIDPFELAHTSLVRKVSSEHATEGFVDLLCAWNFILQSLHSGRRLNAMWLISLQIKYLLLSRQVRRDNRWDINVFVLDNFGLWVFSGETLLVSMCLVL